LELQELVAQENHLGRWISTSFFSDFPEKIGLISVDPSKRKTGGALLGDKSNERHQRPHMRSLAYVNPIWLYLNMLLMHSSD
jgi:hypothetical protein